MPLLKLREMSNRYGSDARYVLAGGGNTSLKDEGTLYVKGSGVALGSIREDQFVRLDRDKLEAIWDAVYPEDFDAREAAALGDLMAARLPGETGRPSVETLLHDILPFRYVCHLHPAAVNALTCAKSGKEDAAYLFPDALWVDAIMPGYVLAAAMKTQLEAAGKQGKMPDTIFIENHGVFIGGDTIQEIDERYAAVMGELCRREEEEELTFADPLNKAAAEIAPALRMLLWENGASYVRFAPLAFASADALGKGLILTLSPDHMVYCGREPLFVPGGDAGEVSAALPALIAEYRAKWSALPRVIAVGGLGLFASGETVAACDAAHDLMLDAAKVCRGASKFGGPKSMPAHLVEAIGGWEVERYRKAKVTAGALKRAAGKIALVTGAAQGFGLGIAQGLAAEGAVIAVADINEPGARKAAAAVDEAYGTGAGLALPCDVADEASVELAVRTCVLRYGGLDILIANAGIVRAGALDELPLADFELSAKVNYTAFFLCARYAARAMKIQCAARPGYGGDIIQVNSKSGLSGSNKNFAYAGAKFGGIGLVQSFALELAPLGIKVNAVCPGNFLDGPMWSDPENGLFVQYLNAGKVPGARTVQDVRAFYESKVPLGRGCRVIDVVRAILYIAEQEYETGQALPVTGGQEMLR